MPNTKESTKVRRTQWTESSPSPCLKFPKFRISWPNWQHAWQDGAGLSRRFTDWVRSGPRSGVGDRTRKLVYVVRSKIPMTFIRERSAGIDRIFGISSRRDALVRTGSTDGRANGGNPLVFYGRWRRSVDICYQRIEAETGRLRNKCGYYKILLVL